MERPGQNLRAYLKVSSSMKTFLPLLKQTLLYQGYHRLRQVRLASLVAKLYALLVFATFRLLQTSRPSRSAHPEPRRSRTELPREEVAQNFVSHRARVV